MIGRNDPCFCGSGKKWKHCHYPRIGQEQNSDKLAEKYYKQYKIVLKNKEQIEGIKEACKLAADILDKVCDRAKPGVTTDELDIYAQKLHKEAGAIAAPLGYGQPPFPKSICTSLNDVICHGIPDNTPLQEGDILNVDVSCILNGYFGDCSKMVALGPISSQKKLVVDVSLECLKRATNILKPGILISDIGDVIEDYAHSMHCSVVNQFVGHGVGLKFHEPPQVPHNRNNIKIPLAPGMTFTIEPMINAGAREATIDRYNHWTARTVDGLPSAQWEHTVLITETGYEILTQHSKEIFHYSQLI